MSAAARKRVRQDLNVALANLERALSRAEAAGRSDGWRDRLGRTLAAVEGLLHEVPGPPPPYRVRPPEPDGDRAGVRP